jgi:hypothetical protein
MRREKIAVPKAAALWSPVSSTVQSSVLSWPRMDSVRPLFISSVVKLVTIVAMSSVTSVDQVRPGRLAINVLGHKIKLVTIVAMSSVTSVDHVRPGRLAINVLGHKIKLVTIEATYPI